MRARSMPWSRSSARLGVPTTPRRRRRRTERTMAHVPAERCLSIIELLAEGASTMSLGDIADRLRLPKSATHRLLSTLVDVGWAEQDSDTSFYRLTLRLATLGQQFFVASGIPDVCQPLLDRLAQESGDFARLSVVDGDSLVW